MLLISACFYLFVYFCTRFFLCFDIFFLYLRSPFSRNIPVAEIIAIIAKTILVPIIFFLSVLDLGSRLTAFALHLEHLLLPENLFFYLSNTCYP